MSTRVVKAVADVLSNPENSALSAEEVAELVIQAYEDMQASTHNLIVLGHFRTSETESYVAAVGPFSTRAPARARGVGERFAWDYKTRSGKGQFVLVPLIRNPAEAWDEARNEQLGEYVHQLGSPVPGIEPSYEPMRFELSPETRTRITTAYEVTVADKARLSRPACTCGLPDHPRYTSLGQVDSITCPLHGEGS